VASLIRRDSAHQFRSYEKMSDWCFNWAFCSKFRPQSWASEGFFPGGRH